MLSLVAEYGWIEGKNSTSLQNNENLLHFYVFHTRSSFLSIIKIGLFQQCVNVPWNNIAGVRFLCHLCELCLHNYTKTTWLNFLKVAGEDVHGQKKLLFSNVC